MATCKCGCGTETTIAKATDKRWGYVKGQPLEYAKNHWKRGVKATDETRIARYSVLSPDGCVIWVGGRDKDGYALYTPSGGKTKRLARFLYEQQKRPLEPHEFVCHTCDNPSCINVDHLFIGTNQENMDDMREKGRSSRSEGHANTTLTADDVRAIRASEKSCVALAKFYGVSGGTISNIRSKKTWKYVE